MKALLTDAAAAKAACPSRRLRVLLVIAGLPAGGAERQMTLLARHLDRHHFEVGVLIFNAASKVHYTEIFGQEIWFRALDLSHGDGAMLFPRLIRRLGRAVSEFAPDVIHASLNVANHATRIAGLLLRWRVPVITSVRIDFRAGYGPGDKRLERLLWRRSAHMICNASRTRDQLIEDLGVPPERVSTIANGVDDAFLGGAEAAPPAWWPAGKVALTVGRFTPQKNHLALVDAIAALDRRDALAGWMFVLLGEGELNERVRAAIVAAGLEDRITMAPPQTDMPRLYRSADLFVLPSLYEGMPNALLEAAAAACPLAVSTGANDAGIVAPERGWLLSEPLAESLEAVLKIPQEVRAAAGRHASDYVAGRFSGRRMAEETADIYRRVATKPGG